MGFSFACVYAIFLNIKVSSFIINLDIKRRISKSPKVGRKAKGNVSKLKRNVLKRKLI